jgi:hypothetical protein
MKKGINARMSLMKCRREMVFRKNVLSVKNEQRSVKMLIMRFNL